MEALPRSASLGVGGWSVDPKTEVAAARDFSFWLDAGSFREASVIPCVLHEDGHLLVVDKPAGLSAHAPSPFAGEGLCDWLRHREPRWAALAIFHRLDKETSGVMVFGKTAAANRALAEQFATQAVLKRYLMITDRPAPKDEFIVKSNLIRAGKKYASVTAKSRCGGETAEMRFRVLQRAGGRTLIEARPITGRAHQIRVHAAESGLPVLGDTLYGGTPAARVHLHAAELRFRHPDNGEERVFQSEAPFAEADGSPRDRKLAAALGKRRALIEPEATNAVRLIHGASDGWPGWYVDRLGDFLCSQSASPLTLEQTGVLRVLLARTQTRGAYHKRLDRQARRAAPAKAAPQWVLGEAAPDRFEARENGARFELSLQEGYSVGLFLDQRDNRRRFLTGHVAAGFPPAMNPHLSRPELLNTFAYTCGFSVCAALGGWRATSLDLSKKHLDWGRRNFARNGLDPSAHDFIFGDTFDWLRRFAKRGRKFDAVALDPPTFSQSKTRGVFRADKDYGALVGAAAGVLRPGGLLLASTNAAGWPPEAFVETVRTAVREAGRRVTAERFFPQPPDFPVTSAEPGRLKTIWLQVAA